MSVLSAQRLTFRLLVVEEGGGLVRVSVSQRENPLSVTLPWFSFCSCHPFSGTFDKGVSDGA